MSTYSRLWQYPVHSLCSGSIEDCQGISIINSTSGTETYHHQDAAADSGSVKLAKLVQQEVVKATGYRDRGVKTAEFGVLTPSRHHPDTAACLVEVSFLTDPKEEERLGKDEYKQKLAEAISVGIFDYVRK